MPDMDGLELLRIAKEQHPQTLRMVITAYSDVDPILRAINEGLVARYIVKPWNRDELRQVLRWATEVWTFGKDSRRAAAPPARDRAARHARQHRRRLSSTISRRR